MAEEANDLEMLSAEDFYETGDTPEPAEPSTNPTPKEGDTEDTPTEPVKETETTDNPPEDEEKDIPTEDDITTWKKEYENKKNWQAHLTQKSQLIANLSDEQVQTILDKTDYMKDLSIIDVPDVYDSSLTQIDMASDDPFTVEVIGEDDIPVNVDIKQHLRPFIATYQKEMSDLRQENEQLTIENGINAIITDTLQVPELAIENLNIKKIDEILTSGDNHPDFEKLERYKLVSQYAGDKQIPFKDAYNKLFAKEIEQKKEVERVKNNIESANQTNITTQKPVKDETDAMFNDAFGDDTAADNIKKYFG